MEETLRKAERALKQFSDVLDDVSRLRTTMRQNKVNNVELSSADIRSIELLLRERESFNVIGEYLLEILCDDSVTLDAKKKHHLKQMLRCSLEENIFN